MHISSSYAKILGETNFHAREIPQSGSKVEGGGKKVGENNGQLRFVRHHVWRTQARLDQPLVPGVFLSFSSSFFSAFYFSPTSENFPCVKICFPQYFGITRRNMQRSVTAAWATRSPWSILKIVQVESPVTHLLFLPFFKILLLIKILF